MQYPQNLTFPPHHPHEIARRQAKCHEQIKRHTSLAVANGLLGLACLGILFNYSQKDFAHKKEILIPLLALFSAEKTLGITAHSLSERKKWVIESQRLQNY